MMADPVAASPAPAEASKPQRGLSIDQAVAELAKRREQSAQPAPPAAPAEEAAAAEPDNSDQSLPEEAEGVDAQPEPEAGQEAEAAADQADDEDVVEAPDGTRIKVSELWSGYQKGKDYTRKTQALAEERRALESQRQVVEDKAKDLETGHTARNAELEQALQHAHSERQRYAQSLQVVEGALATKDKEWSAVDWQKLEAEDPLQASTLFRHYTLHQEAKRALTQEKQELADKQRSELGELIQGARNYMAAHIQTKYPEAVNGSTGLMAAMLKTAQEAGYTQAEIEMSLDPRGFALWHKATQYDLMMAKQKALSAGPDAPKPDASGRLRVVKAGAPRPPRTIPSQDAAAGRAMQSLQRSGSIEDAMKVMQARRAQRAARQQRG